MLDDYDWNLHKPVHNPKVLSSALFPKELMSAYDLAQSPEPSYRTEYRKSFFPKKEPYILG